VLPASPTFLNLLLLAECQLRFDLSSLKIIGFGAEPMPERLLARLKAAFPGVDFQQKFGTSETNAIRVRNRADGSLFMAIDDPGVEWKVVDGELWLRSRARIVGYLNTDMARFTEDGWFRTGDLVVEDGAGNFRVMGRKQEMINVGGEKVLPTEVEGVLLAHPAVRECVVRGEPHPLTGQQVRAEVVADPTAAKDSAALRSELRRHCRERLAAYKVPSRIVLMDHLDTGERFKMRRLPATNQAPSFSQDA
jgi:acyl-CoA synthetase (AMP-forming)/AMP-acid ligase II